MNHPLRDFAEAKAEDACRWFLLCENTATTTVPHPTLGDVPTCARCAKRVEEA